MRSIRVVEFFSLTLAVTLVHGAARAEDHTDERPISAATQTASPVASRAPSVEPGSPQSPDDLEIEYRLMVRMAALDPARFGGVHVRSVRGAVTLSGSVPDELARDRALVMANTFDGVRVVRNELNVTGTGVARGGGPAPDDVTIVSRAQSLLQNAPGTVGAPLRAFVKRGVVTVQGTVATFADARRVVTLVKSVPGVVAVHPRMRVNESRVVDVVNRTIGERPIE